MRALGIDFGERRIGLAISDPEGRVAVPLTTLERKDDRSAAAQIAEIARREGVERLVVGEPVGLDGERGPAAERVRAFAEKLAAKTGLPMMLIDEALTSVEAAARLREAGAGSGRGRAGRGARGGRKASGARGRIDAIDAMAAQILLQDALDRPPGRHSEDTRPPGRREHELPPGRPE